MNASTPQRVTVVSGASSGIGLVTAKALATDGWKVIAMGRDPQRCAEAAAAIREAADAGGSVHMIRADLAVLAEVDRAAREILAQTDRIDVMINNAGGTSSAIAMTSEGNEAVFASNHLAPCLLTARLLPCLRYTADRSGPGQTRILNVSSSAHETSPGLDWTNLQSVAGYVPILAYCNAKLANLLFTRLLAARLDDSGIRVHAIHPGAIDSNFYSHADEGTRRFAQSNPLISSEAGADTIVWLAMSDDPDRPTGGYYTERALTTPSPLALDDAVAQRLWRESERLIRASLKQPNFRLP